MKTTHPILVFLLLAGLCTGIAAASTFDASTLFNAVDPGIPGPQTLDTDTLTVNANTAFTLDGRIVSASTYEPFPFVDVVLEERGPGSTIYRRVGSTTTDGNGEYAFSLTRSTPGLYYFHVVVYNRVLEGDWAVTVLGTSTVPTTLPITTVATGGTMAQAYASYEAGNGAWSNAWGASDFGQIRMYLNQARTHYATCLNTANQVNDPSNAANLALMKSVSTAYIALADAALAMYDGADVYSAGRGQMNAGQYAAAAASFQSAADTFLNAQTLFGQATTTLQGVSYTGTSFGDGTAYTAAIVPVLNGKAAYMGEFVSYARGWQHTALAYQASANGDQATFRSEVSQAMALFGGLRTSSTFGADATSNYNILAGLPGNRTVTTPSTTVPTTKPTSVKTTVPTTKPTTVKTTVPTTRPTTVKTTVPTTKPTQGSGGNWETQIGWDYSYSPSNLGAGSGSQVAWKWNFGDGGTSTQKTGVHVYTREGYWTVKLTVTYADGSTRSFSTSVHTYYL